MYNIESLLTKASVDFSDASLTLAHFQLLSFAEIRKKFVNSLTWDESKFLFKEAKKQLKRNKLLEVKAFTRANPQLPLAVRNGIEENAITQSYDSVLGFRSHSFVKSGSVASMFSPAAYLTELYREAKGLHSESSSYNLNDRRPDLAELALSQENMDEEISTLSLSNDILLAHLKIAIGKSAEELQEFFSTARSAGELPYHQPYETLRQCVLMLDPELSGLSRNPTVMESTDSVSLLAIMANISPELYRILTEKISIENAEDIFKDNFPENFSEKSLSTDKSIAKYYGCDLATVRKHIEMFCPPDEYISKATYENDMLSYLSIDKDGGVTARKIIRKNNSNNESCNYWELVYKEHNNYCMRVSFKTSAGRVSCKKNNNSVYLSGIPGPTIKDTNYYSSEFSLPDFKVGSYVNISAYRYNEDSSSATIQADADFYLENLSLTFYLLQLNKNIRLCRATGLEPAELMAIVRSINSDGSIDDSVMQTIFYTLFFRQYYNTTFENAVVLSGCLIGISSRGGEVSHFDRLFNTPPLSDQLFYANGDSINIASEDVMNTHAYDALLRGLDIRAPELFQLASMASILEDDDVSLKLSIENISTLYRLSLASQLLNITVNELELLFSISEFKSAVGNAFMFWLHQTVDWLSVTGISPSELWLLSSRNYGSILTPEMVNFRNMVSERITVKDIEDADDDEQLLVLSAPYVAGALTLSSPEMARCILQWCAGSELVNHMALKTFLLLVVKDEQLKPSEEAQLVCFFHALAQLALIVQTLLLSEAEVSILARHGPTMLPISLDTQKADSDSIRSLHAFHKWVNTLGHYSSIILDALSLGNVDVELMAKAMNYDAFFIRQAMSCVGIDTLTTWMNVWQTLQWIDISLQLNTSPTVVMSLVNIRYTGTSVPAWDTWQQISRSLEAALKPHQTRSLVEYTSERMSDILSTWYLTNSELDLNSRDSLYSYLLIDNQVSAQVTTTRLAEAIAGVQLYINRALNGSESGVQKEVVSREFFTDWELNSRYSTWSGISRLVYYPENYVDPLQRVGQTSMMGELLQSINQSQLSEDTVDDAFRTYLASFETVSDLKTISAYHDNVNSDSGKTYFIGGGREAVPDYWWRCVDMTLLSDGSLPASAWSEWVKIKAPVTVWNDMVRPVVFRERLYILWVEREEIAEGIDNPTLSHRYSLKLAFLRHDGNWSTPWSYDVTPQIKMCIGSNGISFSASQNILDKEKLIISFYAIKEQYPNLTDKTRDVIFMIIDYSGRYEFVPVGNVSTYNIIRLTYDCISSNRIIKKANYRFSVIYDCPSSLSFASMSDKYNIVKMKSVGVNSITIDDEYIILTDSRFSLSYSGGNSTRRGQLLALKYGGVFGDRFLVPNDVDQRVGYLPEDYDYLPVYNVYNVDKNQSYWYQLRSFRPALSCVFYELGYNNTRGTVSTTNIPNYGIVDCKLDKIETQYFYTYDSIINDEEIEDYDEWPSGVGYHKKGQNFSLDTSINLPGISMKIDYGDKSIFLTGDSNISLKPEGNFDNTVYKFEPAKIPLSDLIFVKNKAEVNIRFQSLSKDGEISVESHGSFKIQSVDYSPRTILNIIETDTGVQYIELGVYRIRINTLLGPELISRANLGIGAILSMDTQLLTEDKTGQGTFVTFELGPYDKSIHGNDKAFTVGCRYVYDSSDYFPLKSGILSETSNTVVTFFAPRVPDASGNADNIHLAAKYSSGLKTGLKLIRKKDQENNPEGWTVDSSNNTFQGLISVYGLQQVSMPLDFNSSCALYYWELFYYVPMMCFRRFLDEKKFTEARAWMSFIWNPNGYIINGNIATWDWNCRPLEESTSWNANPLDTIDPDAVAQNDPSHYKMATFMAFIEMLITRADMCYRELTRDALNEARMWYVYALELMGEESHDISSDSWSNPTLALAASDTQWIALQKVLGKIEAGEAVSVFSRTANSLTGLFLPEFNPALDHLWTTLRLRLYNLRNNLSIDGMPLSLSVYAEPTDPKAIQSSLVQAAQGGAVVPNSALSLYRFPAMLERTRNLVEQLTQFGSSLLGLAEHQDVDELSNLMLQQGLELSEQSLRIQQTAVDEVEADIVALQESRRGAQERLEKYSALYDENMSRGEREAMALADDASMSNLSSQILTMVGGAADMAPNIFGLAAGGMKWGAVAQAKATVDSLHAVIYQIRADKVSRSEHYRRRREEWEIQRDNAQSEVKQIDAQLANFAIRRKSSLLQVKLQKTQQGHTLAQLEFMQRKFTSQSLYNWMRGKLSAIYYQFFDITQSHCLLVQEALRRDLNNSSVTFIRGNAWNGSTAGFMAGESLMLCLAEMEKAWTERDTRALEVTRTVSLAQVYAGLKENTVGATTSGAFILNKAIKNLTQGVSTHSYGNGGNEVRLDAYKELMASIKLSDLKISSDYKENLGKTRRIKQVSVTLPALIGPYGDVRAVLSYEGSVAMPRGCSAVAISHGMNDSGQFQLDFNDVRYLPFEGIPVSDTGTLIVSFPDATDRQRDLLESLSDIILHIHYTIQS